MRYIDAEKLWEDIESEDIYTDFQSACIFKMVREKINTAPTADVEEVRHGQWLLEKEPDGTPYCFHCSECDNDFHCISITSKYAYCPNCGAKMDKEKEWNTP